ncbi:MAG: type II secretion system protein [Planctomycetota bacterium]
MNAFVMRRAFTLIELLVAIAIIAVLVAVLLPALGQGVGRARQIKCMSQCRSMTLAALDSARSSDDRLPIAGRIFVSQLETEHELAGLATYEERGVFGSKRRPLPLPAVLAEFLGAPVRTGSREVLDSDLNDAERMTAFACPSDRETRPGRLLANQTLSWSAPMARMSYGFNDAVTGAHPASGPRAYGYTRKVTFPAETMLFADAQPRSGDAGLTPDWLSYFNESDDTTLLDCRERTGGGSPSVFAQSRHLGGTMSVGFLDGHVSSVRIRKDRELDDIFVSVGVLPAAQ